MGRLERCAWMKLLRRDIRAEEPRFRFEYIIPRLRFLSGVLNWDDGEGQIGILGNWLIGWRCMD